MPSKKNQNASSDASRVQWTCKMDEHLIDALKEEHLTNGRNLDGTWKTDALEHAAKAVLDNTGIVVNVGHVRARRRYLHKKYKKAKECNEKSGFGWSPTSKMFTADPHSWKDFVEAHPDYKSFRSKAVPFFDDLDVIFGKEKVTGLRNYEGFEAPADPDPIHEVEEVESMMEGPSGSANSAHFQGERCRKRRRTGEDSEEINMLMGMVEAAKEVAAALRPQKCDKIEKALRDLPDVDENDILDGMDLLGPDPQLAEVFFGFTEKSTRKAWLWRRLNRKT